MIKSSAYISELIEFIEMLPVCETLGLRQCGKTTRAREIARIYDKFAHLNELSLLKS
jgi:predicted AAA+ superfamily ATPase